MNHPFRAEFWSKKRLALLAVLILYSAPPVGSDPASALGEIFGWILVTWALIVGYGKLRELGGRAVSRVRSREPDATEAA